ncbi:MAG TPA: enoyl-CoA hydratase-related protein [Actinomycetota bacterium]|nr:enoyl-CoA hydratase-related protein [Actinomycetota bacterium]
MPVQVESRSGVRVLTLDRPDVLNAFDTEFGKQFLDAVTDAAADPEVRCIVITGAGRAFSSGEDLGALAGTYEKGEVPELGTTLVERYNPLIRAIVAAEKPVVAAINGVAAGAGASIALACDYRVASAKAKLVIAFTKVGLVPDSGAVWFLSKMIGTSRAWELAASARPVDAAEALQLGLVHRVAEPDEFEREWRALADELASGPTKAYALTKRLLHRSTELTLDEQLDAEVEAQTEAGRSTDHLEGVQAFLSKRPPKFQGR